MSFTAINEVTRGLRMMLHSQLVKLSPRAVVTLRPPGEALPDASGVNFYLYRIIESPSSRNEPWPGDRVTPPSDFRALGLQLFYLLTPLAQKPADDSFQLGDDAHTMLGAAMLTLQENPVLNDVHLPGFDADEVLPEFLLNSFEKVHLSLLSMDVEELSKIWATINQPYRLSVAYEASLVQLTPTPPPPVKNGRVFATHLSVIAREVPRVRALAPPTGPLGGIDGDGALVPNELLLTCSGLDIPGAQPVVRIGGQLATIRRKPASGSDLTATLPDDVEAGPQADVRVTLNGLISPGEPFTITPWLAQITPIRTALDPALPADQQIALAGNGFTTPLRTVRLEGPGGVTNLDLLDGGSGERAAAKLPATLTNGTYRLRVVLKDQANSVSNSRTLEVIPRIDKIAAQSSVPSEGGKALQQLTLIGARLDGSDIRLVIDGVAHQLGANSNAMQIVHALARPLSTGRHTVAVNVDGQVSRPVEVVT